jgi:arylsulfatase A-like enzyme
VTHSFCSPSRAGILTGRYQARFGHERNPRWLPEDHDEGLPTSETLFPALLAKEGYATGWIGKWHLGAAPEFHPEKRGFTETFGFLGGGHHYANWKVTDAEYNQPILRNGKPEEVKEHLTLAFGHEAAAFITRHPDQPWFLYLAFNAPHTPHEPTPERLAKFSHIEDKARRAYAAQISLLDDAIGETLDALQKTGQEQRTIVFFMSDNGAPNDSGRSNQPFRGWKGTFYEGGIHVPFVVRWPGHLPAGRDYEGVVSSLDVAATALEEGGVSTPTAAPLDGVNLIPFLSSKKEGVPHPQLFWRQSPTQYAIRDGSLKLTRPGGKPSAPELYDLSDDLPERNDLAKTHPAEVQARREAIRQWASQMSKILRFPGLSAKGNGPAPFGAFDPPTQEEP